MAEQMKPSGIDWIGDIPKSWKVKPIAYMTKSRSGGTPDRNNLLYWENGTIPWMSSGEVNKVNIYDTDEKITTLAVHHSSAKIISKNAVMVALNGQGKTKGMSAILRIDSACNQSLCAFSCNAGILYYEYLFWCFQTMYTYLRQMSGDDVRDGLAASYVKKQKIPVPKYEEQQAIADFLDKECAQIDSIAADLEKQIELLQQYKKSLITETVTKGLDKTVPMKDSGVEWLGKIPEHWDVEPIKYRVTFHNGDRGENYPSKSELQSEGIPFINAGHLEGDGLNMDNMDYISEEKYRIMGGVKLRSGDILYCLRGSVGKNAIVDMNQGTVASSLVAIRSVRISAKYLYYCLNSHIEEVQRYLWDNGTAQPNLSADNLGKYKICIPPVEEQMTIVEYLNNICSQVDNLIIGKRRQLSTIQQHKKSLIYEYVTGKKRVKEVR